MTMVDTIEVSAERDYAVLVGRGLLGELTGLLTGATRVGIIHPGALRVTAEAVREDVADHGFEAILIEVPEAEEAKTAEVLNFCWTALGQSGFTRNDVIIGLGGGATTDLAGFVAATWLRGIRVVQIPTTLLAMVDAAVGGKTGINTPDGKNLVGAFHSPSGVICDLNALQTLPTNDLIAGMAEVVKVGFTSDLSILEDLRTDVASCLDPDGDRIASLVTRAITVKANVVAEDFREVSATSSSRRLGREVLNYGHTFGHAIERTERYRWRHGAAIAVGMVYVAELARLGGRLSDEHADLHIEVLQSVGLPTRYTSGTWDQLLSAMQLDKKARGSLLRFVVLEDLGRPVSWEGPDPALLAAAYAAVSE